MARRLDYKDHRRELDENRYVYAVVSRRARGLSIGVNLNPDKACNFDCPYCQVDRTTPGGPSRVEVADLAVELEDLLRRAAGDLWTTPPFDTVAPELRRVADVAFAGDGEPTTPPEFPAAARAAREARDRLAPGVPCGSSRTRRFSTRTACGRRSPSSTSCGASSTPAPRRTSTSWTERASPSGAFSTTCSSSRASGRSSSRASSSRSTASARATPRSRAWVDRLREIVAEGGRIDHVQVYTVARAPSDPRCGPLDATHLEAIAAAARDAGFTAAVYA